MHRTVIPRAVQLLHIQVIDSVSHLEQKCDEAFHVRDKLARIDHRHDLVERRPARGHDLLGLKAQRGKRNVFHDNVVVIEAVLKVCRQPRPNVGKVDVYPKLLAQLTVHRLAARLAGKRTASDGDVPFLGKCGLLRAALLDEQPAVSAENCDMHDHVVKPLRVLCAADNAFAGRYSVNVVCVP